MTIENMSGGNNKNDLSYTDKYLLEVIEIVNKIDRNEIAKTYE